ncbi:MAG: prolyl oligopeptidase family protein [Bacteroidia bacterium]
MKGDLKHNVFNINKRFLTTTTILGIVLLLAKGGYSQVPVSKKEPVIDNYHGIQIADPYRWLENDRSKETEEWVKEQNKYTYSILSKYKNRKEIENRLQELWNFNKQTEPFYKAGYFYCYRNSGLQNQNILYRSRKINAPENNWEEILNPNKFSEDGTISLNTISISKNGDYLAYSISKAGSDWQEILVKDLKSGELLKDTIKWVKFSSISWRGNKFYYSRYDEPKNGLFTQLNTGHKVYIHEVGKQQKDDELIHQDKNNPDYNFYTNVTDDEKYLIIYTSQTTSGNFLRIYDLGKDTHNSIQIGKDFEYEYHLVGNKNNTIYFITNEIAPNQKLDAIEIGNAKIISRKTIIKETENLLKSVNLSKSKLILHYLVNACSSMQTTDFNGMNRKEITLPGICKINGLSSSHMSDSICYNISQFYSPSTIFLRDLSSQSEVKIFEPKLKFNPEDFQTKLVFYKSKDGTKIPMFITSKKEMVINENTPCMVYGYGGFNISLGPEFRTDRMLFIEKGGIYCVPILRGGGEFGEEWHKAGTKCKKQNVFDDFMSACKYLKDNKMTSASKMAIHGRSNGGLLIGAVMAQEPDICKVALPMVGVLDMLRFHLFTIGRAWTVDYGCSENKEEFNCLFKYSPYHNVKRANYPATMILTGDHDDRVVPAHSFKFAARLQELNNDNNPCLIRIDENAGHGSGKPTSKQIAEFADMYLFTFENLGLN